MIVAVLPFLLDEADPDAADLARFLAAEIAAQLPDARLVLDQVELSAAALGDAAAQLGAGAALGARLALAGEEIELSLTLADARGEERAAWTEMAPLGSALQLGRKLAREVLLALGENAPPESAEPEVPPEAVLRLVRAQEPEELLALLQELPELEAARRALLVGARDAAGGDRMPPFLAALERLVELRPDDVDALLALGDYRALHFDAEGARTMYLAARDAALDVVSRAEALGRLASLAAEAGRADEAIAHLREAVRMVDDADLHGRLGALLLAKDPGEGLRELTKATVLAPEDPALHLQLLKALRDHDDDEDRLLEVAARTARLCEGQPRLEEELQAVLSS